MISTDKGSDILPMPPTGDLLRKGDGEGVAMMGFDFGISAYSLVSYYL